MSYLYLALAISFTAFGQFFYKKYTKDHKFSHLVIALLLFLLIPILNFLALRSIKIDIVYMLTSLTILIVVFLSRIFFNENIDRKTLVGISFIILGLICYTI
ncbi:SMR family transporter [Namhaeicola litoreus]|uniref:SMR family transporter n=1 Tax=Namhaeicola litoreus TaxID=1052145 RepID=A0ABW3Y4B5_9FLAO